jgi:hypothetical protein
MLGSFYGQRALLACIALSSCDRSALPSLDVASDGSDLPLPDLKLLVDSALPGDYAPTCFALRIDQIGGRAQTVVGVPLQASSSLTVEAWIWLVGDVYPTAEVVSQGRFFDRPAFALHFNAQPRLTLDPGALLADTVSLGHWVHLAGVFDQSDGSDRIFVDGIPTATKSPGILLEASTDALHVGSNMSNVYLAEVRISGSARYTQPFVPEHRLDLDSDTLALYHCDEQSGAAAHDAARGNDATLINGARFELPPICLR